MFTHNKQQGGKIYGKGSKGYLIDLYSLPSDDNISFILPGKDKINLINAKGKVQISLDELNKITSSSNLLVKRFNNLDNYISEMEITTHLINSNIVSDYIIYKGEKYYGIQDPDTQEYGILKNQCTLTADKFKIVSSSVAPHESFLLNDFCRQILDQITNLQNNNYVHCDIKADNIMLCPSSDHSVFKLIDWDLAVNTETYTKSVICKNRYIGSATHTSPILENTTKELCGTKTLTQSLKRIVSTTLLERRNITSGHNLVNDVTKMFLLSLKPSALISLYKYHIDLYSFSITLFEMLDKERDSKILEQFCSILQNTVFVSDSKTFMYVNRQKTKDKEIHTEILYDELLALVPNNFYLIYTDTQIP